MNKRSPSWLSGLEWVPPCTLSHLTRRVYKVVTRVGSGVRLGQYFASATSYMTLGRFSGPQFTYLRGDNISTYYIMCSVKYCVMWSNEVICRKGLALHWAHSEHSIYINLTMVILIGPPNKFPQRGNIQLLEVRTSSLGTENKKSLSTSVKEEENKPFS